MAFDPPSPFDLFGEIPVTWDEVDTRCLAVAGLNPDSWRRPYYIQHWNVVEAIRQAKLAGTFATIVEGGS
jgi:hypothetical protein